MHGNEEGDWAGFFPDPPPVMPEPDPEGDGGAALREIELFRDMLRGAP